MSLKKYDFIDSLRGIGCIIVVIAHLIAIHPKYGIYASGCGKIGVWLLLVITAFLLSLPSLNNQQFKIKHFYTKRFFRIFPCFIIALIIALLFGFLADTKSIIAHLTLNQGIGHLWTIPVELKFYIIFPIFILLYKYLKKPKSFIIIFLMLILSSLLFPFTQYIENSISLIWYLPVFLIGMLLSFIFVKYQNNIKASYLFDGIIFTIITLFMISTPYVRQFLFQIPANGYLQNKYLFFAIGWAIIIFSCQHSILIKHFLESSKLLKFIGSISFPLYLIHYILIYYFNGIYDNYWLVVFSTLAVSFALATLMHYTIEKPFIQNIKSPRSIITILLLVISLFISCLFNNQYNNQKWQNRLYVPTMIEKIGDDYFIVDCWNHRVLTSKNMNDDISQWKTITDDYYLGGHSIASDGSTYVLDNTERDELLVYQKDATGNFIKKQVIKNIDRKPHYVVYDKLNKEFYVIGSRNGTIYRFKNIDQQLVLLGKEQLGELQNLYVRSISLIDGDLYAVSTSGVINQYQNYNGKFTFKKCYNVPNEYKDMNQISKINQYFYITINSSENGGFNKATLIRFKDFTQLSEGNIENLKTDMQINSQPYFITNFDDAFFMSQISANDENGIKSFKINQQNEIYDVKDIFYWQSALSSSKQRFKQQYPKEVDLMIFMGQSNMAGKGDYLKSPSVKHGYEFRSITDPSKLYPLKEPFGLNENNANGINDVSADGKHRKLGGLVASFANSYYASTKVPVVGVSASQGATTIAQWVPGTSFYNDAIARLNSAKQFLHENRLNYALRHTYMIWCQGESDGDFGMSTEEYYQNLDSITSSLINQGVVENTFIIRIGNYRDNLDKYNAIQLAQTQLALRNSKVVLISTKFSEMTKKNMMSDVYHYTQEGYNLVGNEAGINAANFANTGIKPNIFDYKSNTLLRFQ